MPTQKTVTFYLCNVCKKDYDTSDEATACEASHGTLAIHSAQYNPTALNVSGTFPETVILTDGTNKAQYTFFKKVKTVETPL